MGKSTVFFFPEKVYRDSLIRFGQFCFSFFFGCLKKKQMYFFFPEKVCNLQVTHSVVRRPISKQRPKKVKNRTFCRFPDFFVFFFLPKWTIFLIFFALKKVCTSLTHSISGGEKKNSAEKKNTQFSLTHSKNTQNGSKLNFFREKKYGTFGVGLPI